MERKDAFCTQNTAKHLFKMVSDLSDDVHSSLYWINVNRAKACSNMVSAQNYGSGFKTSLSIKGLKIPILNLWSSLFPDLQRVLTPLLCGRLNSRLEYVRHVQP